VAAAQEQAARVLRTSTRYLIPQHIEFAEPIAAPTPMPDAKAFSTTSGTGANDAALLPATAHRRSHQVPATRNPHHRLFFSSMSVAGDRFWSATSLSPF
jgi:4-aminobutyrate aminotransferase